MKNPSRYKSGDTLIEVTIAVGIFSMIAIAIVSVMSGGVAGAQNSLEITLAREEIDAQAEAIRFIHADYVAGYTKKAKENAGDPGDTDASGHAWTKIIELAEKNNLAGVHRACNTNLNDENCQETIKNLVKFSPASCSALYGGDNSIFNQNAFAIDTRNIKPVQPSEPSGPSGSSKLKLSGISDNSIIEARINENNGPAENTPFVATDTYPHLLYDGNKLAAAQGIYVIAVPDGYNRNKSTNSADVAHEFYDFYIRTCWYGSDTERPSTISTVMRLYNPELTPVTEDSSTPPSGP